MKYIKIKYLYTIVLFVLCVAVIYAVVPAPNPNPPAPLGGPVDPDNLPINENLVILLVISLIYGSYKIYKHIQYKKASI